MWYRIRELPSNERLARHRRKLIAAEKGSYEAKRPLKAEHGSCPAFDSGIRRYSVAVTHRKANIRGT